jgi:hypothetical protein
VVWIGQHALDGVDANVLNEMLHCADAVLLDYLVYSDDVEGSRLRSFYFVENDCSWLKIGLPYSMCDSTWLRYTVTSISSLKPFELL